MVQVHGVLLHTRLVTRLVRVLGGGGVGGQVERKKERVREGRKEGLRGEGEKREREAYSRDKGQLQTC